MNAGCPCTAPGVPAIGSAVASADNQITVSWTPGSPPGSSYTIYRSTGACPAGTCTPVRSGQPSSPWTDTTVSGGSTYAYEVTTRDATGVCESAPSGCVSAAASGPCTLAPTLAGVASVANAAQATCAIDLTWAAATAGCSGPVRYAIYRSTTAPVPLLPGNVIASGIDGTTYRDADGLSSGTAYSYVVHAVNLSNGLEDSHTVEKRGAPTGAQDAQTLYDTFEGAGGFDLAGWTHGIVSGSMDWMWSTAQAATPTHAWFAEDAAAVGDKVLASPAFAVLPDTSVTFHHRYAFDGSTQSCCDGGTLEYALGPDFAAWTVVPDTWFTAGGFNGTVSTSWSNSLGGKRAWCHQLASWTPVSLGLLALAGQTVKLRWHEGNDSGGSATGWYVDSVTIANTGTAADCSTASSAPPPVTDSGANAVRFSIDHGNVLNVTYDATTCSAQNVIVLYNALGSWDGYAGCAQPLGGSSGSMTVDSTGQENVWYNLVWTDGGTAGHPGFASSGARTWNVGALCGMNADDHSRSTCP